MTYVAGPIYTTIYPASGNAVDWAYGVRGALAFAFELRDTGQYGFLLPPDQIRPNGEEVFPAVLRLIQWAWERRWD
jgi:murein tripeptide amidase MpaA